MTSLIQKIASKAALTFKNPEMSFRNCKHFRENLDQLISLVQKLSADDLCLVDKGESTSPSDAPVAHVNIYDGDTFTMAVFIVKEGKSMPLHDHPKMTGICKVLIGSLKLTSFEGVQNRSEQPLQLFQKVCVKKHTTEVITSDSPCQVLLPTVNSYHTMQAVGGNAAFFDILAPPYFTGDCERICCYYREAANETPKEDHSITQEFLSEGKPGTKTWLTRIPSPVEYFCDSQVYRGPSFDVDT